MASHLNDKAEKLSNMAYRFLFDPFCSANSEKGFYNCGMLWWATRTIKFSSEIFLETSSGIFQLTKGKANSEYFEMVLGKKQTKWE